MREQIATLDRQILARARSDVAARHSDDCSRRWGRNRPGVHFDHR
jgi:hypothetical protein